METLDALAREGDGRTVMLSCELDLGIDWLLESIWRVSLMSSTCSVKLINQELGLVKYVNTPNHISRTDN
jgi:hypothetical protein